MLKEIKGRVWKFGDNIDTDLIYPGKCLPILDPQEMAKHALEGYDKEFPNKIQKGDIILAVSNFGCGSSREQAATSLKFAGISCVIAKSFSRIFFRNAINQGLALVQSREAYDLIEGGEILTVNYVSGEIITENRKIPFPPLPEIVMGILEDGGLIEHLKKSLKK